MEELSNYRKLKKSVLNFQVVIIEHHFQAKHLLQMIFQAQIVKIRLEAGCKIDMIIAYKRELLNK